MDVLTRLRQRFTTAWGQWSGAQRAFAVGALCVVAAFLAGLTYWFTQPAYMRLASDLTPAEAAEITTALESAGVAYELSLMGSSIMVSRDDLARARGVVDGAIGEGASAEMSTFGGFGMREDGDDRTRALESRIATTLAQLGPVESAIVNIGRPDPSPWIADQKPTTASVLVTPRANMEITPKDAAAIVDIVSRSVDGLDPANVSVVDSDGRRLNMSGDSIGEIGYQQDHTHRVESMLAAKAENVLRPLLGPDNVIVVVTAEIDFDTLERTTSRPDAESSVPISETITTTTISGITQLAGGPAGTSSNLTGGDPSGGMRDDSAATTVSEHSETIYAESSSIDRLVEAPGTISRLSVAALVDLTDAMAAQADAATGATPPTQDEIEAEVLKAIEAAVGFSAVRQDTIQLTVGRIIKPEIIDVPATAVPFWTQYSGLLHNVSLGVVGLSTLLLGWLILRRIGQPVIVQEASAEDVTNAARRLSLLNDQVRDDPEMVAKIMSNWLGSAEADATTNAPSAAANAARGRRAA